MGRKSGGNAWNDFQRAHASEGMTRSEAAAAYRGGGGSGGSSNVAPSSGAYGGGGGGYYVVEPKKSTAWNEFQHDYGGRGLSKSDLSRLYGHQTSDGGAGAAKVKETRPKETLASSKGRSSDRVSWNTFQNAYGGKGLTKDQISYLYHEYQKTELPSLPPMAYGTGAFSSGAARMPSPVETPPTSHRREPEKAEPSVFDRGRTSYVDAADGFSTPLPRPLLQPTASPFALGGGGFGAARGDPPAPTKCNLFGAGSEATTKTTAKDSGFGDGAAALRAAAGFGTTTATPVETTATTSHGGRYVGLKFGTSLQSVAPTMTATSKGVPYGGVGGFHAPTPSTSTDYLHDLYAFGRPAQPAFAGALFGVAYYKGFEFEQAQQQQPLPAPPQEGATTELDAQYLKHFTDATGRERSPEELRAIYKMGKTAVDGASPRERKKDPTQDAKQVRFTSAESTSKEAKSDNDRGALFLPVERLTEENKKTQPESGKTTKDEQADRESLRPDTKATKATKQETTTATEAQPSNPKTTPTATEGSTPSPKEGKPQADVEPARSPFVIRKLALTTSAAHRLAKGSCSTVYTATMNGSTQVATKVVPNLHGRKAIARFEDEMATLRSLPNHPHLVRHYGHVWLNDGDHVGVVFELLPAAQSLRARLYRNPKPLSETTKHRMLLDVLEALVVLHAHDITHRDLSPTHVLLLPDSNAIKLIDYGLPTLKNASATGSDKSLGFSPAYASPELVRGQLQSHDIEGWKKSDVLSFTVLLVELLMEEPPWEGELPITIIKTVDAYESRPFVVENLRVHGVISPRLEKLVSCAWHEDPDKRPTAARLLKKLETLFG